MYASILALFTCNAAYAQKPEVSSLLPGIDLIGRSYDIFGLYAENSSVKRPILDFSNAPTKSAVYLGQTYKMPAVFDYINHNDSDERIIVGENSNELSKKMGVQAGLGINARVFSASVDGSTFTNRNTQTYNYYSSYTYIVKTHQIALSQSANRAEFIESLKPFLAPDFAKDINNSSISPEQIFKTYRTHFLADIILGAKIQQDIRIESYSQLESNAISAAVTAEYKVANTYVKAENEKAKTVNDKTFISMANAKGGDIALLGKPSTNNQHYADWAKTVANSPVLVDFNTNSFIPIWELANTQARKDELKKYFDNVICKNNPFKDAVINKPSKPEFIAYEGIPHGRIVDGRMIFKGPTQHHVSTSTLDIWLNASNTWKWGSEVFQRWTFANNPNGFTELRGQKPYPSGNITETRKQSGDNDFMKIERYTIHENGDFYLHIFVKYISGEKPNNNIVYEQWIQSDKPLNVRDINLKKKVPVSFFDRTLQFDLQF